jgi:hypothetical protein
MCSLISQEHITTTLLIKILDEETDNGMVTNTQPCGSQADCTYGTQV